MGFKVESGGDLKFNNELVIAKPAAARTPYPTALVSDTRCARKALTEASRGLFRPPFSLPRRGLQSRGILEGRCAAWPRRQPQLFNDPACRVLEDPLNPSI
jgi:hypothetical protein